MPGASSEYDLSSQWDMHTLLPNSHTTFLLNLFLPKRHISQEKVHEAESIIIEKYEEHYKDDPSMEYLLSGSSFEGLSVPVYIEKNNLVADVADIDVMVIAKEKLCGGQAVVNSSLTTGQSKYYSVTESSDCFPGFVRLRFVEMKEDQDPACRVPKPGTSDFYLSSGYIRQAYSTGSSKVSDGQFPYLDKQVHGPAYTTEDLRSCTMENMREWQPSSDSVLSFPCPVWPDEASEWVTRPRKGRWPGAALVDEIVKSGCHIVPVPHPKSQNKDIEWRFSFSLAEKKLARSLNDVQRQCYILLKIIHNEALKLPKLVVTYHLKNVLFNVCERLPEQFWIPENLAPCLMLLLDELALCLAKHELPNYFVPGNNLIAHLSEDFTAQVAVQVMDIRKDPLEVLFKFNDKNKFPFSPATVSLRSIAGPILNDNHSFLANKSVKSNNWLFLKAQSGLAQLYLMEGHRLAELKSNVQDKMAAMKLKYDEALEHCKEMLVRYKQLGADLSGPDLISSLALGIGNTANAISVLEYMKERFQSDDAVTASFIGNLACMYHAEGCNLEDKAEKERMLEYFEKADSTFKEALNKPTASAGTKTDYANFLCRRGRHRDAIPYLLDVIDNNGNGGNSYGKDELKTVDENIQGEIEAVDGQVSYSSIFYCFYLIIRAYVKLEMTSEAQERMLAFQKICDKLLDSINVAPFMSLLGYAYNAVEDYSKAKAAFARAVVMHDGYEKAKENCDECMARLLSLQVQAVSIAEK